MSPVKSKRVNGNSLDVAVEVAVAGGGVFEGGAIVGVADGDAGAGSVVGDKRMEVAGAEVIGAEPQPTVAMRRTIQKSLAFKI
jgi:hypothetical protein